jgi:hypothetical protein
VPDVALRTVDLFPTMLQWLGVAPPAVMDGELVWNPAGQVAGRKLHRAEAIGV